MNALQLRFVQTALIDVLNDLVKCYNSTLSAALDRHAPLVTKFFTVKPLVPWFSEDIRDSRRGRRRAERNGLDLEVSMICLNLKRRGTLQPT